MILSRTSELTSTSSLTVASLHGPFFFFFRRTVHTWHTFTLLSTSLLWPLSSMSLRWPTASFTQRKNALLKEKERIHKLLWLFYIQRSTGFIVESPLSLPYFKSAARTSVLGTDNLLKERGLETIEWRDTWSAGLFLCTCSIRFVDLASILKVSNGFKLASLKVWKSFLYYASW